MTPTSFLESILYDIGFLTLLLWLEFGFLVGAPPTQKNMPPVSMQNVLIYSETAFDPLSF